MPTNAEATELQSYRAISPWMPLTVLLGLASPLALVHPLLWTVPLTGILLAWIGIKQVSSDSRYTGQIAIRYSLALTLLFGTMAPVRYVSRQWILTHQAKVLATDWVRLIRSGDFQQAHQWTLPPDKRAPHDISLAHFYNHSATSSTNLNEFENRADLLHFRESLGDTKVRIATKNVVQNDQGDHVVLECFVDRPPTGVEKQSRLAISLRREISRHKAKAHWRLIVLNAAQL